MSFYNLAQALIERLRVEGAAKATLRHHEREIKKLGAFLEAQGLHAPGDVTAGVLREYQRQITERGLRSKTRAHIHVSCRLFLRYLYEQGWTLEDLSLAFARVTREADERSVCTQEEMAKFLSLPDTGTPRGVRDRAMFELMYSSALRREEVSRLELYDLNVAGRIVRVIGKGDKERVVPVGKIALYWIDRYIKDVRGTGGDPHLFLSLKKPRGLTPSGISLLFDKYLPLMKKNGLPKISPHALRHACATHMLQHGADSTMIQAFLGHRQLITTQIYTHVLTDDLAAVIARYHPRGRIDFFPVR